jgi:hypothetical protein
MGGSTGRPSQATQQRVEVKWKTLRLAEATEGGYAETTVPIDELIADAVKRHLGERKPIVVYICDEEDEKTAKALDSKVFCDEKVGLALKRFVCLKGAIQTIPDDRMMAQMAKKTPIFHFYDPAGNHFNTLSGRKATSKSGFSSRVGKLWDLSFTMRLKDYTKRMGKVLDRIDKLEAEKERLSAKMERAADNPGKLKGLQREEEALTKLEEELQKDEQEILETCALKKEFLPGEESAQSE